MPRGPATIPAILVAFALTGSSEAGFIDREPEPGVPLKPSSPQASTPQTPNPTLVPAPQLVDGRLPNGVRYLVLRNANPPGRALVWLNVRAGCLNDPDDRPGLAHFVEHMAFQGSENLEPGTADAFLESLDLVPSRHAFATTGYDSTTYELTLPDTQPATFDTGLLFLSDVAGRLTFPQDRIDQEREVLIQERRVGLSSAVRLSDAILPRLAPGSLLASRTIVGQSRAIASTTRQDLADFYARWYTPASMTVIAVGDADPAMIVDRIALAFDSLPERAATPAPDPAVAPTRGVTAIVASDREVDAASVAFSRVEPARAPVTTVDRWRRQLVERLALRAFNQRLEEQVALGRVRFRSAEARAGQVGRAAYRVEAQASGPVSGWPAMLADLGAELRRARQNGLSTEEITRARDALLAVARRSAETEPLRPGVQVVRLLDASVGAGEPYLSPAQELELGAALLPGVTDAQVNAAFAELFDPDNSAVILTLPSDAAPVSDAQLLAAVTGGPDATPGPDAAPAPRLILDKIPTEGEVAESNRHVGSSVLTLRLENNIIVHYRLMEHRHETVTITALMPGGEIRETAATRGLTRAAAEVFRTPATSSLSADEVAALTLDRGITCTPAIPPDALGFSVTGPPEHAEAAFQLAHALLTDPALGDAAVEQWKARQLRALAAMRTDPAGLFASLLPDTLYPTGEVRTRTLTDEQVRAVTPGAAQAWLAEAMHAPLEVSIVGNLSEDRAVKLALRYFGSLPDRQPVDATLFRALRALPRPESDRVARREVAGTDMARLTVGFFGPDAAAVRDTRHLTLAARVLTARLQKSLRDQRKLATSIAVGVSPGVAYPGYGLFYAAATGDPKNADELAAAINAAFDDFAKDGPTPDELKTIRRAASHDLSTALLEPGYWTDLLRDLNYRAGSLDEIVNAPTELASDTADDVRKTFARYHAAGPALNVVVIAQKEAGAAPQERRP